MMLFEGKLEILHVTVIHKAELIKHGILCDYKVSVTTGNCNGASTNAPISIKLYGTNGYADFVELVDSETHRVPFLKDQIDVFTIQTYHVGELAGITIGHNQKETRSSWFLNKVSIDDPIRNITYNISCNAWLSKHQEEIDNLSNYSTTTTTTTEDTIRSNITSPNQNDQLIDHKQTKKHRKQKRLSIDRTTVAKTRTSLTEITNHHSQPQTTTATIDSDFNRDDLSSPPVRERRNRSPILSRTPATNSDNEDNPVNHSRSTTPTSSSVPDQSRRQSNFDRNTTQRTNETTNDTLKHHSTDHDRPPARLEKRNPSLSVSPERPIKSNEQTNENDVSDFFD
ncbi:unnamed protein product [Rotaria sordida]|uniref:PLAT domain-containing protein n=1 Tax=Rotaria sordida TaxID=392033 RepID=A0A818RXH2_9BILA|nr:unnamed protein product [Rotaria sordida]